MMFLALTLGVFADSPPPPPGGAGTTNTNKGNNQLAGGGAPIGSGLFILVTLAFGYGAKRAYSMRKSEE